MIANCNNRVSTKDSGLLLEFIQFKISWQDTMLNINKHQTIYLNLISRLFRKITSVHQRTK